MAVRAGTPGLIGLAGAIIPLSMLQRKAKEPNALAQMPDAPAHEPRQTGAGLSMASGWRLKRCPSPIEFDVYSRRCGSVKSATRSTR